MPFAYQEYYTVSDYEHWEGAWELIEGMPYAMSPSPSVTHQTVCTNIIFELKSQLINQEVSCGNCQVLMETDWHISNDTVVRPDAMLICKPVDEIVNVTPELVVEVVSLSSTKRDELVKFELYCREGVKYYMLVYPEKHLAKIYQHTGHTFQKMNEVLLNRTEFCIEKCCFNLDFSQVWR